MSRSPGGFVGCLKLNTNRRADQLIGLKDDVIRLLVADLVEFLNEMTMDRNLHGNEN